jgi:hypothetical protein
MYIFVLGCSLTGLVVTSSVGAGLGFVERSAAIVASEPLFRLGLVLALVGSLSTVVLAVALYVTVRPVDRNLGLIGLTFRTGEAAVGGVGMAVSFAVLQVRSAAAAGDGFAADDWDALAVAFNGVATTEVAAIFFSLGSTVFFYLLLRSRYIPRVLAGLGLIGSACYAALWIGRLLVPDVSWLVPFASAPILIAEVVGGIWLLLRSIDVRNDELAE